MSTGNGNDLTFTIAIIAGIVIPQILIFLAISRSFERRLDAKLKEFSASFEARIEQFEKKLDSIGRQLKDLNDDSIRLSKDIEHHVEKDEDQNKMHCDEESQIKRDLHDLGTRVQSLEIRGYKA